jgi:predicted nucleic acid-binding protein
LIVVDASVAVAVLLRLPGSSALEERLYTPGQTLHAPHLIDIEVAHVLRRSVARGVIEAVDGRVALLDFASMPLQRYSQVELLARVWDLRHNFSACDAAYVALAESLDAELLTLDRRLATAGHRMCGLFWSSRTPFLR